MRLLLLLCLTGQAFAGCAKEAVSCPKLEHAALVKLKPGVPPFIFSGSRSYYVEMRDGKTGTDCFAEVEFPVIGMGVVILADNMDDWHTKESLHHEVSHIAAHLKDDGKCKFKDEDAAIEHLSPGWIEILKDPRNAPLLEYLSK